MQFIDNDVYKENVPVNNGCITQEPHSSPQKLHREMIWRPSELKIVGLDMCSVHVPYHQKLDHVIRYRRL